MALYKRGNVWWMNFTFNGHHVQKSTKCKNKRDAGDVERAYRTELAKGEVGIETRVKAPIFSKAIETFLAWSEGHHAQKPLSHSRNKISSKPLIKYFGDTPLDRITREQVENYRSQRLRQKRNNPCNKAGNERTIRPATVNRELGCLKRLYNVFIERKIVKSNPVKGVRFLDPDNLQTRVLSYEEERLYLMAARQPFRDIAIIMLDTGMRPGEVLQIERKNVFLEKRILFVPNGKTKSARRNLPLSERALDVLKKRVANAEEDYLFPAPKNSKHKEAHAIRVNSQHHTTLDRSGIAFCRLYDLRHTFATRILESGADLLTLAALLGHANLGMVMRYAHPSENHKFDAVNRLEQKRLIS